LIAAKLNIASASDPSCIQTTINQVDALIGNLIVPPVGNGVLACNISGFIDALDDYNSGKLPCADHCNDKAAQDPQPYIMDNPCVYPSPTPTPTP
jgi:hypothetical protein